MTDSVKRIGGKSANSTPGVSAKNTPVTKPEIDVNGCDDSANIVADVASQIVADNVGYAISRGARDRHAEMFDIGISVATIQPIQRKSAKKASLHSIWTTISRCRFGYTPRHWASIRNQVLCDHVHCETSSSEGQPPQ